MRIAPGQRAWQKPEKDEKMTTELICKLQKELDNIVYRITRARNQLKYEYNPGSHEYNRTLKQLEELIKKKVELETAIKTIKAI
ncbi:hypothetical protein DRN97_02225 [Methanosarcinales archaeon]|nr:MAG: hypothetical protein DRN97_02225 [Methanosarcinales archaeon]